jgi:hypothetical protein
VIAAVSDKGGNGHEKVFGYSVPDFRYVGTVNRGILLRDAKRPCQFRQAKAG